MKPFILLFVLLSFLYSAQIDEFANGVGYLRSYNMALESAKKEQKLIMLLVVSDYCPWCKKFESVYIKESLANSFTLLLVNSFTYICQNERINQKNDIAQRRTDFVRTWKQPMGGRPSIDAEEKEEKN